MDNNLIKDLLDRLIAAERNAAVLLYKNDTLSGEAASLRARVAWLDSARDGLSVLSSESADVGLGARKIALIKLVRAINLDLGLGEAKQVADRFVAFCEASKPAE